MKWSAPKAVSLLDDADAGGEPAWYVLKQIQGYPKDLEAIYEQLLLSIDDNELEVALRLFECLSIALAPLTADDLKYLVCLEAGRTYNSIEELSSSNHFCERSSQIRGRVSRLSQGLIKAVVVPNLAAEHFQEPDAFTNLQFDHDSAREFMLAKGLGLVEQRLSKLRKPVPERHLSMAMKCLSFLKINELVYDSQHYDRKPERLEVEEPFVRYASLHWFEHAHQAEHDLALCEQLLEWLERHDVHFYSAAMIFLRDLKTGFGWDEGQWNSSLGHLLGCVGLLGCLGLYLERAKRDQKTEDHLECTNRREQTPLIAAAEWGQRGSVKLLLERGANADAKDQLGDTALHLAASRGDLEMINTLLDNPGTDPNQKDERGATAFTRACSHGTLSIVQSLAGRTRGGVFSKSQSPTWVHVGWQWYTPLYKAWASENMEVFRFLLNRGNEGDIQEIEGEDSMLHSVCDEARHSFPITRSRPGSKFVCETLTLLLESKRFNVNLRGTAGQTPFLRAVCLDQKDIMEVLLQIDGVDVNRSDDSGETPLLMAIRRGNQGLVQRLLGRENLRINDRLQDGSTILHVGADHSKPYKFESVMNAAGIDPNVVDGDGFPPLMRAFRRGRFDVLESLIRLDHRAILLCLERSAHRAKLSDDALEQASARAEYLALFRIQIEWLRSRSVDVGKCRRLHDQRCGLLPKPCPNMSAGGTAVYILRCVDWKVWWRLCVPLEDA